MNPVKLTRKKAWKYFGRRSLTVKLTLTFSCLFFLILALGTAAVISITKRAIAETSVTTALYQTHLLKLKLLETMLNDNSRHEELEKLLDDQKKLGQMEEVNVFNPKGVIRYSSFPERIGGTIGPEPDLEHHISVGDSHFEFTGQKDRSRLRIVHPIRGGNQCTSCHHNESGAVIGGVELFVPLQPIYQRFTINQVNFILAALLILAVGVTVIRWLVHRLVKEPIRKLTDVMEKAEKGELDVRTKILEDPDLRRLAMSFNKMVQGIQLTQRRLEQQHQRELTQANRLSSLGQLISNVSHEIKNPLASISSTLHALKNEFQNINGQEIFMELNQQIGKIGQTVNNLLRFARQAPPRFELCPVIKPIREALHLAEHRFQKLQIQVTIEAARDISNIWLDSGQLQQVFLNLFLNAAAAMPSGGKLNIRIASAPAKTDPDGQNQTSGVEVEIQDTGQGIKEDILPKIFDPFFTTRRGGTGLGLSVVKGILEKHGGSIRVESIPGQGTVFYLFLPQSQKLESS